MTHNHTCKPSLEENPNKSTITVLISIMEMVILVLGLLMTLIGFATGDNSNSSVTYLTVTVVGVTKTLSEVTAAPITALSPIAPVLLSSTVNTTLGAIQTSSSVNFTAGICGANNTCGSSITTPPYPFECGQSSVMTCSANESMIASGSSSQTTTMSTSRNVTLTMTIHENITVTLTNTVFSPSALVTVSDDSSIVGGTTSESPASATGTQEPATSGTVGTAFANVTSDVVGTSGVLPTVVSPGSTSAANSTSAIIQGSTATGNASIVSIRPPMSTALPVPQPNKTWTFTTPTSTAMKTSSTSNAARVIGPPKVLVALSACFALLNPVTAQTTVSTAPIMGIRGVENGTFSPWWSSILSTTVTEPPTTVTSVSTTSMFRTTRNITMLVTVGLPLTFTDTVTWTDYVSTGNRLGTTSNGILPTPGVPQGGPSSSKTANTSSSEGSGGNLEWLGIAIGISVVIAFLVMIYVGCF